MKTKYVEALEKLWDLVSDAVEDGYIEPFGVHEALYEALVQQMLVCQEAKAEEGAAMPCQSGHCAMYIALVGHAADQAEEIERLTMERDNARSLLEAATREGVIGQALADVERLKALLAEARDDIHDEVANRYPWKNKYPQDMLRYERDMDIVRRIDAALDEKEVGHE